MIYTFKNKNDYLFFFIYKIWTQSFIIFFLLDNMYAKQ